MEILLRSMITIQHIWKMMRKIKKFSLLLLPTFHYMYCIFLSQHMNSPLGGENMHTAIDPFYCSVHFSLRYQLLHLFYITFTAFLLYSLCFYSIFLNIYHSGIVLRTFISLSNNGAVKYYLSPKENSLLHACASLNKSHVKSYIHILYVCMCMYTCMCVYTDTLYVKKALTENKNLECIIRKYFFSIYTVN